MTTFFVLFLYFSLGFGGQMVQMARPFPTHKACLAAGEMAEKSHRSIRAVCVRQPGAY